MFNPKLLIPSLFNSINPLPFKLFKFPLKLRQFLKNDSTSSHEEFEVIFSVICFSLNLS